MPLFVLLILFLTACAQQQVALPATRPPAQAIADVPPHLAAARQLLAAITPDRTEYRHKPSTISFRPGEIECRTDCSGFITGVFQHAYAVSDDDIRTWLSSRRPLASTWHRAIKRSNRFTIVPRVEEWKPGDLIAIAYPKEAKDTGHTLFVNASPVKRQAARPLLEGTTQYEVEVIDVTGSPHSRDTRRVDGKTHAGLGRGVIRVYANPDGTVAGHTWGLGSTSTLRPQAERNLLVGRVELTGNP
jgi:hypothetical protein